MAEGAPVAFFSYSREDSDFVLRLAGDLKAAGAGVWLDQLDIVPGQRWDRAVEDALTNCPRMIVILSPASVSSTNVMDEVSFALEEQKTVIPVVYRDCTIPFRLRRVQHVDLRQDYARGLQVLLKILAPAQNAGESHSVIQDDRSHGQPSIPDVDEHQPTREQSRLEDEARQAAIGLEAEQMQAAERVGREQERSRTTVDAQLHDQSRRAVGQADRKELESEPVEQVNHEWTGGVRRSLTAAAIILIVAFASGLVLHYRGARTAATENWIAHASGTNETLTKIFGTSDGKRLWAVIGVGRLLTSDDVEKAVINQFFYEGDRVLESDDRGQHWNPRNTDARYGLESIFGTSDGKTLWVGDGRGTLLESDDSGEHWYPRTSGTDADLDSIWGTTDGKQVWAVGEKGTIVESNDAGEHWSSRNSGTGNWLASIFGTSGGQRLWAVGEKGTILESDDGGEHWNASNSGTENSLTSIFGTSDGQRLWVVGEKGTILESDDSGEHWNPRHSGTENILDSIFGTSDGKRLWAVGAKGTILEAVVP